MEKLNEYPIQIRFPIAWGDLDSFEHVNNVKYYSYFERALTMYLEEIGFFELRKKTGIAIVMAKSQCNYMQSLSFPDNITVGAKVIAIGRTSLTTKYLIVSEKVGVAAEGESVLVMYDLNSSKSVNIPVEIRTAITKLEKRTN